MAFINRSVGENGVNLKNDVLIIQKVFNRLLPAPLPAILENGHCDRSLIEKIHCYQSTFMGDPSGCIDPEGSTLRHLWPVDYANPSGRPIDHHASSVSETNYHHQRGADFIAMPSQAIGAPVSGKVMPVSKFPINGFGSRKFTGLEIHACDGSVCQVWNISPRHSIFGSLVHAGDILGIAKTPLNLQQSHFPAVHDRNGVALNHIHVRIFNRYNQPIDPSTVIPAL